MRDPQERADGGRTTANKSVVIELTAEDIAFDKKTITAPAGAAVTLNFNNKDSGIPHNFALYKSSDAKDMIFQGEIITGPGQIKYQFNVPATPGTYFFRCDVHPTQMTGDFVVQ